MSKQGFEPNVDFKILTEQFLGCDGGDPGKRGIWFCGIEWGGGFNKETKWNDFKPGLNPIPKNEMENGFFKHQYNQRTGKLFTALTSACSNLEQYKNHCMEKCLFQKESNTLKLNLFPFAFKNDDGKLWQKWVFEKTGFFTKEIYKSWCLQHRFPQFTHLTEKHLPRLIICSSVGYLDYFLMAFFGEQELFDLRDQAREIKFGNLKAYLITKTLKGEEVSLLVTPFFSFRKNSLNSDRDILNLVESLKDISPTLLSDLRSSLPIAA